MNGFNNTGSFHRLDMMDEWLNGAYDEDGDAALCDICGSELKWNPIEENWYCPDCGQTMDRPAYLNHIGAEPPGDVCLTECWENYPLCKQCCTRYSIPPDDPMLC